MVPVLTVLVVPESEAPVKYTFIEDGLVVENKEFAIFQTAPLNPVIKIFPAPLRLKLLLPIVAPDPVVILYEFKFKFPADVKVKVFVFVECAKLFERVTVPEMLLMSILQGKLFIIEMTLLEPRPEKVTADDPLAIIEELNFKLP